MSHLDPAARAVLIARLRRQRVEGRLRRADAAAVAAAMGVSERTVWRWASGQAEPRRRDRAQYELTEQDRRDYADWAGNVAAMWRARRAAGEPVPPLRTLQRAFARDLTPGERAAVTDGVAGRRRHEVYLRWEVVCRNARWEADHKELPVLVSPPRGVRAVKPWVTVFLDCYSRLIMGWALSLRPDAATVLAALRRGLVIDPARGSFGGVPRVLVPDNGLEFATTALARVCATIGTTLAPTEAYAPHQKGKIERANRTVDQEFLAGLPFNTEGPRAVDGRLYGPAAAPMSLTLFTDLFAEWVIEYNTVRAHSALDGLTPLQRWETDPTPIHEIPAEQLRWLLLADAERTVARDGVHFGGHTFIAGELNGRVGERVQVRYTPHDLRQIEIFRGDTWLCTAYPQGVLSDEQRAAVLARRRADAKELGRRQRQTSRRARSRLAPITAPISATGDPDEVTVLTAQDLRDERHRHDQLAEERGRADHRGDRGGERAGERDLEARDRDLQRLARTDLLNLNYDFDFWNPPEPVAAAGEERTGGVPIGDVGWAGPTAETTAETIVNDGSVGDRNGPTVAAGDGDRR